MNVVLIAQVISILASILIVVMTARTLSLAEIGTLGIAVSTCILFDVIKSGGMGAEIIRRKALSTAVICEINSVIYTICTIPSVLLLLAAPFIASFFGVEEISLLIQLFCLNILVSQFEVIEIALKKRDLDFRSVSLFQIISLVFQVFAVAILLYLDFGVYTIPLASFVQVITQLLLLKLRPHEYSTISFSFDDFKSNFKISFKLNTINLQNTAIYALPDLLLGKLANVTSVSTFSRGMGLGDFAAKFFMNIQNVLLLPMFSSTKKTLNLNEILKVTILVCSSSLLLAALNSEFLLVLLFGEKWLVSSVIASLACGYYAVNIANNVLYQKMLSDGNDKLLILVNTCKILGMILLFFAFSNGALPYIVVGMLMINIFTFVYLVWYQASFYKIAFNIRFDIFVIIALYISALLIKPYLNHILFFFISCFYFVTMIFVYCFYTRNMIYNKIIASVLNKLSFSLSKLGR